MPATLPAETPAIDRPFRSLLYIPASKPRALEKARDLPVDAIVFDLEDAVTPEAKVTARQTLADALEAGGYGDRYLIVRVNGADTPWGAEDLAAVVPLAPHAILLPKVGGPDDVAAAAGALRGDTTLWAMMETAAGIVNAAAIARAPRLAGLVMGTNDLARELGCRDRPDRLPLLGALQTCLLAARAAGIPCIDGVYNAFRDEAGLRDECLQGRDLGMDGKTLIHPAQVTVANEVFRPSEADADLARRQVAAFEATAAAGQGVAVLDGRIVENLHVDTARRTLAKLAAIAAREG